MTSTAKGSTDFDLAEFVAKNQQNLLRAGAAIVVVGAGTWFWIASAERKAIRAEQQYVTAERSFFGGNPQLAQEDLSKVIQRYGNTTAGVRASVLLAKNLYEQSKPADGVKALQDALGRGASKPFRAAIEALIAAGYENQNKFDSAATAYAAAASDSEAEAERDNYVAQQAQALTSAGKKPEALKIWQQLAARETSVKANEAKLRIGELTATPAKGS
jgi:predicted negative regulator of RcsB-dependent stress response